MDSHPVSEESVAMVEVECPWCAGPAALVAAEGAGRAAVDCTDCGVRVELAPDPAVTEFAHAA